MTFYYDIFEGEKIIYHHLTCHEIESEIGLQWNMVNHYASSGIAVNQRYRIKRNFDFEKVVKAKKFIEKFGEENYKAWSFLNSLYGKGGKDNGM